MASKPATSLAELEKMIMAKVNSVLVNVVADVVKDEIESTVYEEVYEKYDPSTYYRRKHQNMGLADKSQMNAVLINSGVLSVTDDAPFNPDNTDGTYAPTAEYDGQREYGEIDYSKSLAYNIEYGWGYQMTDYSRPRPFIEKTIENLKRNKNHVEALKDGLEDIFGKGNVI